MSELSGGITYASEAVRPPITIEQTLLDYGLREQTTHAANAADVAPDVSGMPDAHPAIDIVAMSVEGIIKKCPHYARLAEINPELARAEVAGVVQGMQEQEILRKSGMTDDAIKDQRWSVMSKQHEEKKAAAADKMVSVKTAQEPKAEATLKPMAEQRKVDADIEYMLAVDHGVIEKQAPERPELPVVPKPTKKNVIALHQPVKVYVAEVKATMASSADRLLPVQDAVPIKMAHDIHSTEQPEATVESAPLADYGNVKVAPLSPAIEPKLEIEGDGAPEPLSVAITGSELATPEQQTWDDMLEKEPPEFCDDFTQALQLLVTPAAETIVTFDEITDMDEPVTLVDAIQELLSPPAVAVIVVERLAQLDMEDKETVTPILKEIVGVVQIIDRLMEAEAESEAVLAAQAGLEELVISLFEQLGIVYELEDIERFAVMLLHSDLQHLPAVAPVAIDLEYEGTHETNPYLTKFVRYGLSDIEEAVERLLGRLVVSYTAHRILPVSSF